MYERIVDKLVVGGELVSESSYIIQYSGDNYMTIKSNQMKEEKSC